MEGIQSSLQGMGQRQQASNPGSLFSLRVCKVRDRDRRPQIPALCFLPLSWASLIIPPSLGFHDLPNKESNSLPTRPS